MIPAARKRSSSLRRFFSPPRLAKAIRAVTFTPFDHRRLQRRLNASVVEAEDDDFHAFLGVLDRRNNRRYAVAGFDNQFHVAIFSLPVARPSLIPSCAHARAGE